MMANVITGLRILVSAVLLFCPVFSPIFYVLYLIAGLSDMVDGIIARKTDSVSEFGSRLDGVADFVFVAVCLIRVLPVLDIPIWLYVWTAVIFFVKIINIISGYIMQKRYVAVHTTMNKATGVLLFMLPLTLTEFYVIGADATACVKSTSYNLVKAGYKVHVISDCVTSYDLKKLDEMFAYYGSKGCDVKKLGDYTDGGNTI